MEKYNSNNFREFLINEKNIPLKNIRFYQVWVDKFLSYYQNNLKAVNYNDIKQFLDELESEGKEDWQIRQAYKAIKVFLEDFMCLLIDFTEDSKNGSTCKPVKKPKTWKEGFAKFINEIRFQHLAYNTEKTYRSWIRRFIEFLIFFPPRSGFVQPGASPDTKSQRVFLICHISAKLCFCQVLIGFWCR